MNIVTLFLKSNPQIQQFYFNKYNDAVNAAKLPTTEHFTLHDDYNGQTTTLTSEIASITVSDHEREMAAHEQVDKNKIGKDLKVNKWAQAEQQRGIVAPQVIRNN